MSSSIILRTPRAPLTPNNIIKANILFAGIIQNIKQVIFIEQHWKVAIKI